MPGLQQVSFLPLFIYEGYTNQISPNSSPVFSNFRCAVLEAGGPRSRCQRSQLWAHFQVTEVSTYPHMAEGTRGGNKCWSDSHCTGRFLQDFPDFCAGTKLHRKCPPQGNNYWLTLAVIKYIYMLDIICNSSGIMTSTPGFGSPPTSKPILGLWNN